VGMKGDQFSLHHFVKIALCPLYVNKIFKVFSVCLFLGGTAFLGYYGYSEGTAGLKLSDVVLDGSYLQKMLKLIEEEYPLLPGGFNLREIDFIDDNGDRIRIEDFQANVLRVLVDSEASHYVDSVNPPKSFFWLNAFIADYQVTHPSALVVPKAEFYDELRSYLGTPLGGQYLGSIACKDARKTVLEPDCSGVDGLNITIVFSQGVAFFNGIVSDQDYIDAIKDIRLRTDASPGQEHPIASGKKLSPLPMFFSGSLFRYWTQYLDIVDVAARTVGFAMLGVVGAVFFLQFNFMSSILVGCMLLATTVQLWGFIPIIGIKLNGFSLLNLATAVGLGVELSAYVSYSYLRHNAKTDDPDERMKLSVIEMFPPMFQGSMTGFISVIVLNFAQFPFFKEYYFQMVSLMIWLAFMNGIWFLPIFLSIVNPTGLDRAHRLKSLGSNGAADDKFVDDGL